MKISAAKINDYKRVQEFYWEICELMADSPFDIKWKKEIYPANELLRSSLAKGELYIMEEAGEITGAMILNHEGNESYAGARWSVEASADRVMVIHALGIRPKYQGRGLSKLLVAEAEKIARESGQLAIRLDMLRSNVPALKLYESAGFVYQGTLPMFYEDTGWTEFLLYEKPLKT